MLLLGYLSSAYLEGKEVENRYSGSSWSPVEKLQEFDLYDEWEWRIKPSMQFYRVWKTTNGRIGIVYTDPESDQKYWEHLTENKSKNEVFKEWLTDWIEYDPT